MNEAQTLLDIETLMLSDLSRSYDLVDFKSDYDGLLKAAKSIDDRSLEYSPLVQAYLDLMPERMDRDDTGWNDRTVFEDSRAYRCFQRRLRQRQRNFIENYKDRNYSDRQRLFEYFGKLVKRHRKLLLVRVDLFYHSKFSPTIKQFDRDVKKLINRVQNKDTIFQDQVGYAYRLEQGGKSKGYHCHLLVIYNGSIRCKDEYLGQCIGELWKNKITQGDGLFFNCNQKLHKQRYEDDGVLGIGMIQRSVKKSVDNAFKAIGYLASPDKDKQYLRVRLGSRMRQFQIGQFKEK